MFNLLWHKGHRKAANPPKLTAWKRSMELSEWISVAVVVFVSCLFYQLITVTVPPQTSSHPGSWNGRPGIHSSSYPPHCAKPEESGPLILRYITLFSTDQWAADGVLFVSLCLLCVSPAFAEFSFTCMVGLTNALEQDGFISGFMGFYVKKVRGGPALNLPPLV